MTTKKALYLHNPRCSKSRQGLELLENNNFVPEVREYLKEPLSKKELQKIIDNFDGDKSLLVRKKEAEFKESGIDLTDTKTWAEGLSKFPKLLERPLLLVGEHVYLGRPPEDLLKAL